MQQVDLYQYETTGRLGTGADYEVWAAVERQTGKPVVLKRPLPQAVRHQLHAGIEARTDRLLQAYEVVGHATPTLIPLLGYTQRANHDAYFGDALGREYRVIVAEHAAGIPLMASPMARVTGIPIGIGQREFATEAFSVFFCAQSSTAPNRVVIKPSLFKRSNAISAPPSSTHSRTRQEGFQ